MASTGTGADNGVQPAPVPAAGSALSRRVVKKRLKGKVVRSADDKTDP
jgi:hypothetical protein